VCFTGVAAHVRRESVGSKLMIRFERINLSGLAGLAFRRKKQ